MHVPSLVAFQPTIFSYHNACPFTGCVPTYNLFIPWCMSLHWLRSNLQSFHTIMHVPSLVAFQPTIFSYHNACPFTGCVPTYNLFIQWCMSLHWLRSNLQSFHTIMHVPSLVAFQPTIFSYNDACPFTGCVPTYNLFKPWCMSITVWPLCVHSLRFAENYRISSCRDSRNIQICKSVSFIEA